MSSWRDLPRTRLLADVSLWSADLANLAAGIECVEPFADSFHFDVSDVHFAPSLLFFPDLVRALRPLTRIHAEVGESELAVGIQAIRRAVRLAGLALRLDAPVAVSESYLDRIDALLLLGTVIGVRGEDLAPEACGRLASAASLLGEQRARWIAGTPVAERG
jgi:ribulose-phosphate 3-epimerase